MNFINTALALNKEIQRKLCANFAKKYSKLRYYQSLWNNNKIKAGRGMHRTLIELSGWYLNITGKEFESPGRGKKPYVKLEEPPTDNRSKGINKEDISQFSRITPDTFEFKNNIIKIKDSRDVAVLIINLETREITTLNNKYKFESDELKSTQEKLSKIQAILEA